MYCVKCGGEFGPKEQFCFNCGEPRPVRTAEEGKRRFLSGVGLMDNCIPMLWELIIVAVFAVIISLLLLISEPLLTFIISVLGIMSGQQSAGNYAGLFSTLRETVAYLFLRSPMVYRVGFWILLAAELLAGAIFFLAAWRICRKAGRHVWGLLIPIYNIYLVLDIATGKGALSFAIYVLFIIGEIITYVSKSTFFVFILMIVGYVFGFWIAYKAARRFHHGWGYTIGLIFLRTLFILFLGWGGYMADDE